jgi:hypothetical protein
MSSYVWCLRTAADSDRPNCIGVLLRFHLVAGTDPFSEMFLIQDDKVHELSDLKSDTRVMSDEFTKHDVYDRKTNEEISEELNVYNYGL